MQAKHLKKSILLSLLTIVLINITACGSGTEAQNVHNDNSSNPQIKIEHLSAGETSTPNNTANAFSQRSDNMTHINRIKQFELGDDFFQNPWVAGSASTSQRDGLGGLFNNNACQDCHVNDGRGRAPDHGENNFDSMLFKTALANISNNDRLAMLNSTLANKPDTQVGGQLQHNSITHVSAEVDLAVTYTEKKVTFTDGHEVSLRVPKWHISRVKPTDTFDADTVFSARVSPPMIGLGLLALISEAEIIAQQDLNDTNNDGISGKANYVWSAARNQVELGRFGWKAAQPSLLEQSAAAFVNDMGLTNRIHQTENCLPHQTDCLAAPNGNGDSIQPYPYEVSDMVLDAVELYASHLSVPQRKNAYDQDVQNGKKRFIEAGCQQCHKASYKTLYSAEQPELSEQTIFPYTDMLLHDMGADLADFYFDGRAAEQDVLYEFLATATEWRTPPLWGIGRTKTVNPKATFLHDGRARNILEAVLWHGGEAQQSVEKVLTFDAQQRKDLMAFLNDL